MPTIGEAIMTSTKPVRRARLRPPITTGSFFCRLAFMCLETVPKPIVPTRMTRPMTSAATFMLPVSAPPDAATTARETLMLGALSTVTLRSWGTRPR